MAILLAKTDECLILTSKMTFGNGFLPFLTVVYIIVVTFITLLSQQLLTVVLTFV